MIIGTLPIWTRYEHLNPVNQILESLTYTIDADGNRTGMNRQSATLPLPNPAGGRSSINNYSLDGMDRKEVYMNAVLF
ncbi:MAG: hypothetical protein A2Z47_09735 [Thermodesulfovibrio sp. RBG_19FT_COMBO_42_12]|nr:MAG: hypothetical protein A2Z47_09735 [Thermodesulfovibrio sp. RBG_19FT_COMBO_42_12]